MKVLQLKSENVKNIEVIEITPDEHAAAITLSGANGAGKSAVIDSIFLALTGKHAGSDTIRTGQKKATIEVDLGPYKVRRVVTAGGSRVQVTADGETFNNPQALLNSIIGDLTFDPLAFARMKDADRRRKLLEVAGIDVTSHDKQYQEVYDQRREVNREIKMLAAQVEAIPLYEDLPEEPPDRKQLQRQLEDLRAGRDAYQSWQNSVNALKAEAEALDQQIAELQARREDARKRFEAAVAQKPSPVEELQVQEVSQRLAAIDLITDRLRQNEARRNAEQRLAQLRGESERLTQRLQDLQQTVSAALHRAKFPVPDLVVTEDGVKVGDVAFEQLSTGEQVRISTALAMHANPDVRVLLVREGSLLDEQSFHQLIETANREDYQLWIERVAEGPLSVQFVPEDLTDVQESGGKS